MENSSNKIRIKSQTDVYSLLKSPRLYPRNKVIEVQIPHLEEHENAALAGRLNQYQNSCGCKQGMIMGLISLVSILIYSFTSGKPLSFSLAGISFAHFIAGAVIGKLGTMLFLRIKIEMHLNYLFTKNSLLRWNWYARKSVNG